MKAGDTVYINGKLSATIKKFLPNHRVMVTFGATGRYTTSLSNIIKEGNRLILKSDIFKF